MTSCFLCCILICLIIIFKSKISHIIFKQTISGKYRCAPYGIRTHVCAVRGRRPRPLDEGSKKKKECGIIRKIYFLITNKSEESKIIKLLKGFLKSFTKETSKSLPKIEPTIIPRSLHKISRQNIHPYALKVLYRLHGAGYAAYLVGGCVRDLLLDRRPKDFDIATNAHPEEVKKLFRNCRLIGKRFRLAHIFFGQEIIEVATFRTHHENAGEQHAKSHDGMIIRDNVYGTIDDDVWRRDFSVNALYYNIADFSIVDYVDGMQDIQSRSLRLIGDPEKRFHEDPVRLVRAIRFMGKLNLNLAPETEKYISLYKHLLGQVSSARLFQEILKIFRDGAIASTFHLLKKYGIFAELFPSTTTYLNEQETEKLLALTFANTDQRIKEEKTTSATFLFAAILWRPILHYAIKNEAHDLPTFVAYEKAIHSVLKKQKEHLDLTKRLLTGIQEICILQHRFHHRVGARPFRLLNHPRFRAAYDLLQLRAEAGEKVKELANWWEKFSESGADKQKQMLREIAKKK